MFNNFQIDSSIDHGMAISSNSHYEQQLHAQHQYPQQPDPQPPMSSIGHHPISTSNTPGSSSTSSNNQEVNSTPGSSGTSSVPPKPAYGSGEVDDGYTLHFANLEEFEVWRAQEEEEKVVEFVKGDTHQSKAVPPRFKHHTKLVCARHTRSGRKKYVKKYPERQRKLPSRKIEGEGCPASISYKTFYHTPEVRACYNDKHSHDIGEANLLFTRRGRKAAQEKGKPNTLRSTTSVSSSSTQTTGTTNIRNMGTTVTSASLQTASSAISRQQQPTPHQQSRQPNALAGPSTVIHDSTLSPTLQNPHHQHPTMSHHTHAHNTIPSGISLLAPLPTASVNTQQPPDTSQERWDRMAVLFTSIRQHARGFEYPGPSVAALESVLIRLYLESPLTAGLAPGSISGDGMNGIGEGGHGP